MKSFKRIISFIFTIALLCGLFTGATTTQAAEKAAVTSKIHIYTGWPDTYSRAIQITYAEGGDYIDSIQSSSKNLVAMQVYQSTTSDIESGMPNAARIGLYAKKEGEYTVTFNICDINGKVKEKGVTTTVYAYDESPVKIIKFANKDIETYGLLEESVTNGVIKVAMNSGYKLKKIEYSALKLNDEKTETVTTYTKVKNGSKIKINELPYFYSYSYKDDYSNYFNEYWDTDMVAYTEIKLTYTDKYTKEETTYTTSLCKVITE